VFIVLFYKLIFGYVGIPDSVTNIGNSAFDWCASLTAIIIPDSVKEIGWTAFGWCTSLTSVTFKSLTPPTFDENIFWYPNALTAIYVPIGSKAAYQAVEQLSEYDILESCFGADCGECDFCQLPPDHLYISNVNSTENGGYIELHNPTDTAITTKGLYLSNDDDDPFLWQMPSLIVRGGETFRIRTQSNNTCEVLKRIDVNFDLNEGDVLQLVDVNGEVIS